MTSERSRRLPLIVAAAAASVLAACTSPSTVSRDPGFAGEDAHSLLTIGMSTHEAGDPATAIGFFQRAHELAPSNEEVLLALADALGDTGDYQGALEAYDQAIMAGADEGETLVGAGNALTSLNRPELALPRLRRAVAEKPEPAAFNGLGVAHDALGDPDLAQEAYRNGLSLDPEHLGLANNLGLSLALDGQYREAIDILETLVMMPGSNMVHRQNLALAFGLAGDYQRASEIGREDLDELAVVRNISYYRVLGAMEDHARKVTVVGIMRNSSRPADAIAIAGISR